jgi:uncharacterized protein
MSKVDKFAPGSFCWAEMGTKDVPAAKKFYGELLGWSFEDIPIGGGAVYTMAKVKGLDVCAMYTQRAEQKDVPPNWATHVAVENVDAAVKTATALGATVIAPAFDVMESGRMAVLSDPTGAIISLWQGKKHAGAGLVGEPSAMCWNELWTRDTDAATKFYTGLFGWKTMVGDNDPMKYIHLQLGEQHIGGMMKMPPDMAHAPPNWLVYFGVEDVKASAAKATAMGAKTYVPPMHIPGTGTFSVLGDPQGAVFAIFTNERK